MGERFLNILSIEPNLADARQLSKQLEASQTGKVNLQQVRDIDEATVLLTQTDIDAIFWSYSGTETQFIAALASVKQKIPQIPIIVLTTTNRLQLAIQVLQTGAQDCLVKRDMTGASLWRSLQYAIVRQQTEFKIRQAALMKQMLDRIRSSIDLEAILQTAAKVIQEFSQTERVLIYRCATEHLAETTVTAPSVSVKLDLLAIEQFIDAVNLPSLQAILSASTATRFVEDTLLDCSAELQIVESQLVRAYLILPVWLSESELLGKTNFSLNLDLGTENIFNPKQSNKKKLWGMVVAYNASQPRKWQQWEINFLRQLTSQITVAIGQSQLCCQLHNANQKLHKLAILDGLTGIANRRYFDLVLDKEWQRLAREQQPLSLILCDVDYFKAYNDRYGHQQGDRCLQKIAQILQQSTRRPADLVARYGGEEFALILPNTNAPGALFLAHKIIRQLADKRLPHSGSQVSAIVTLSMGMTTKVPEPKQPSRTIIETADNLLYKAKKAGRNQLAVDNWLTAGNRVQNSNQ